MSPPPLFLIRAVENCHLCTSPAGLIVPYRLPDIWTWIRVCSKRCQLRSLTSLRINSDTRSDVESKIYTLQLFNLYLSILYIANYERYNTKFFKTIFFFFFKSSHLLQCVVGQWSINTCKLFYCIILILKTIKCIDL